MKINNKISQDGVSPVVGVMLMLVVTIIIAAVVSAFAGGLTTSDEGERQIKISADFSQSNGMNIYHEGGPSVGTANTLILVRMGRDHASWDPIVYEVNRSVVGNMDYTCMWYVENALKTSPTCYYFEFKAGDVAHIAPEYLYEVQKRNDGTVEYFGKYRGIGSPEMIGSHVGLELYDPQKGKIIASTEMQINP